MLSSKRILIPTDFSKNSSVIYSYANQLAASEGAVVDLVHVIQSPSYFEISRDIAKRPQDVERIFHELKEGLKKQLREELEQNFNKEIRGEVFINEELKPARGIVDQAERGDYDRIIIGSRGRGNSIFDRGSVTRHLIRLSSIPVISFKIAPASEVNKILVPVDGSKTSFKALLLALDMAMTSGAAIDLYSVIDMNFGAMQFAPPAPDLYNAVLKGWKARRRENLEHLFSASSKYSYRETEKEDILRVSNSDGKEVTLHLIVENRDSTAQAIVNYAEENADLVVMTTHGRTGFSKFMIGSVAEKVVRHLDIPICTLNPSKK